MSQFTDFGLNPALLRAIKELGFENPMPIQEKTIPVLLEKDVDARYTLSDKLWQYLQGYAEKHKAAGNGFGYGIAPKDGISRTLSARYYKDGSEILIEQPGQNPRRLTPRECARLQSFPDTFIFEGPLMHIQQQEEYFHHKM